MERCSWVLRMARAKSLAVLNTRMRGLAFLRGMVSVTMSSLSTEDSMFS